MSEPTQQTYPLIEPGDPQTTYIRTDAVLAFVQEYTQAQALSIGSDALPHDDKHLWGQIYILAACRDAVVALGHMAMPYNVTKLEVGNE